VVVYGYTVHYRVVAYLILCDFFTTTKNAVSFTQTACCILRLRDGLVCAATRTTN